MSKKLFVNFPVHDLERSMKFFSALGFTFNPQFTNQDAACMIISEENYAMLLVERFFQTFTPKEISESRKTTEVLVSISLDSREEVDKMVAKAVKAGGRIYRPAQDQGFMYQHGFEDPDGHLWEVFFMDMNAFQATL